MKYLLAVILFAAIPFIAHAGDTVPEDVKGMVEALLKGTQENDLDGFRSVCDDTMQVAMTSNVLASVHTQMSGLMEAGYSKTYMGVLNRGEFKTYYWKISFMKDARNDVLAEMSVKDGKVGGFYLR